MRKNIAENSYMLLFVGVYVAWKVLDEFVLTIEPVRTNYQLVLEALTHLYQICIGWLLSLIGYEVAYVNRDTIMLTESSGLRIMERCLAISASFVFFFTVILYRGKRIANRLLFGLTGIVVIFAINVARLATYSVMHYKCSKSVSVFFHDYGYVVIMYGLILLMIIGWIEFKPARLAGGDKTEQ